MNGEDNFFLRGSNLIDIYLYRKPKNDWILYWKVLNCLCSISYTLYGSIDFILKQDKFSRTIIIKFKLLHKNIFTFLKKKCRVFMVYFTVISINIAKLLK